MRTIFWSTLLAGWLVLAAGGVRGGTMQFSGAAPPTGAQSPVFIERGQGFQGQPAPVGQSAQPGHWTGHTERLSNQRPGDFHSAPVFTHRPGFNHHHSGQCRQSILVFVNGAPFWYSAYTAFPYYYGAPLIDTDSAVYTTDNDGVSPVDSNGTNPGNAQSASDYGNLGTSWGQDLRRDVATWDQFVAYLKTYIIAASPADQAEFREAFINAYRINGAAAYDKAAVEASGAPVPSDAGPKI